MGFQRGGQTRPPEGTKKSIEYTSQKLGSFDKTPLTAPYATIHAPYELKMHEITKNTKINICLSY